MLKATKQWKLTVRGARKMLISCWFGTFFAALATVLYPYSDGWIEVDSLKLALGGLNSLYAPYLGAIALFYWGGRRAEAANETVQVGLSFGLALTGSIAWNLIILLFLAPLLFQRSTVQDALENIAYVCGILSLLGSGSVGYYFSDAAHKSAEVSKGGSA